MMRLGTALKMRPTPADTRVPRRRSVARACRCWLRPTMPLSASIRSHEMAREGEDVLMVGSRTAMRIEDPAEPRMSDAIDLLESGQAAIAIGALRLQWDPAADRQGRRLHVEINCRWSPADTRTNRVQQIGNREL